MTEPSTPPPESPPSRSPFVRSEAFATLVVTAVYTGALLILVLSFF